MKRILVWDLPVRLGHWLMVAGFALAWVTAESERWRLVHVLAGSTVLGVAAYRVLWGFVGSRWARFASFLRSPGEALRYLMGLLRREPAHFTGHNPAAGWAIALLLVLALCTGFSGWAAYQELGGEWLGELHEGLAATFLGVVIVHVSGVVLSSVLHRENLILAMFTGRKNGQAVEAISSARPLAAFALLAWTAAFAWWLAR